MDAPTLQVWEPEGARTWPSWRLRTRVVAVLHGPSCPSCAKLADQLLGRAPAWRTWGVEALVVRAEPDAFAEGLPEVRAASEEALRRWAGDGDGALVVVDRRGAVMARWRVRHPDGPDWHQVDEAARWVGIQEPECGTCAPEPPWAEGP